jgi:hypothetical protein
LGLNNNNNNNNNMSNPSFLGGRGAKGCHAPGVAMHQDEKKTEKSIKSRKPEKIIEKSNREKID